MITGSKPTSTIPPLFSELAKIISGDIDCSQECIRAHSTDTSPYTVRPQAVLYPKRVSDVRHTISFAREYGIPLTVCGGMQSATGGGLGEGVVIDMTRYFSQIHPLGVVDQTITVDAGVRIDDLVTRLRELDVELPFLETENSNATVGGLVATKSATQGTFHAGTVRDWIEGMTVIVDSGEEHHIRDGITPSGRLLGIYQNVFPLVSEHAAILRAGRREQGDDATGYSLWNGSVGPRQLLDQLVGSEGTLAIITSVTFRIVPKKHHAHSALISVPSYKLLEAVIAVAKHHRAERIHMFDEHYRTYLDKFHTGYLAETLSAAPIYLLVTLRGNDEHELTRSLASLQKALPELPLHPIDNEKVAKLTHYTFFHDLLRTYSNRSHVLATSGEGIIVPHRSYAECLQAIKELLDGLGKPYALSGYAGSGHVSVLTSFDPKNTHFAEELQEYREKLFAAIAPFNAGISAVGGDGLEKTATLPGIYTEATRTVFKDLKAAWDPYLLFNPSKKIAVSKDYLIRHVSHRYD